ncbi:MAG: LptF/LptG family permease [bacterium]
MEGYTRIKIKILDRYIIREFLPPFLLGLILFGFILIMNRMIIFTDLLLVPGVTFKIIGQLLWNLLVPFIIFIIPMSILFTSIMLFGRLIHDNEFLALKSCGVHPVRIFLPILIFGVLSMIVLLLLGFETIPKANRSFRSHLFKLSKQKIAMALEEKVFNEYAPNITVFIDTVTQEEDVFKGILVADQTKENLEQVLFAHDGHIQFDNDRQELSLNLKKGSIHPLNRDMNVSNYRLLSFGEYDFSISLSSSKLNEFHKTDKEMSTSELSRFMHKQGLSLQQTLFYQLEWHRRFAFPVACLIFSLLGPAIGLWCKWPGKGSSFALSIAVLMLYYILMTIGAKLLYSANLPAYFAAWLPNVIVLLFSFWLIKRIVKA